MTEALRPQLITVTGGVNLIFNPEQSGDDWDIAVEYAYRVIDRQLGIAALGFGRQTERTTVLREGLTPCLQVKLLEAPLVQKARMELIHRELTAHLNPVSLYEGKVYVYNAGSDAPYLSIITRSAAARQLRDVEMAQLERGYIAIKTKPRHLNNLSVAAFVEQTCAAYRIFPRTGYTVI